MSKPTHALLCIDPLADDFPIVSLIIGTLADIMATDRSLRAQARNAGMEPREGRSETEWSIDRISPGGRGSAETLFFSVQEIGDHKNEASMMSETIAEMSPRKPG